MQVDLARIRLLARRLNVGALVVLVAGLALAVAVFATRAKDETQATSYEDVNGVSIAIKAQQDQRYRFEVERLGGKMGLMIADFNDWFQGLWRGRTLAYTLAVLTLICAGILRFVARELILDGEYRTRPEGANESAIARKP